MAKMAKFGFGPYITTKKTLGRAINPFEAGPVRGGDTRDKFTGPPSLGSPRGPQAKIFASQQKF